MLYESEYLAHYGIKGQKWGMRNYQNEDGSLTEAGKARYGVSTGEGRRRGSGGPLGPNTKAGRLRRNIIIGGVGAAAALGTAAILMKNPSILKAGLNGLRRGMGRARAAAQSFMSRHFHGRGTGLTLPRLGAPKAPGFGSRMAGAAKRTASRAANRASYYGQHARGAARRGMTYARSVGNNVSNRFRGVTFKGARAAKTWRT